VLASFIPSDERIITIEDAAELRLQQPHVVRMEYRPPNIEGRGEVTIRDLVRNALRMRPDRIVVGEVRGGEALDMLQAMNTGHDGSISTIHANAPRDVLSRVETMTLMAGVDLTVASAQGQVLIRKIDTHRFPTVSVTVSINGLAPGEVGRIRLDENGRPIPIGSIRPLTEQGDTVDVVLVVDTSRSMAGDPILQ